VQAVSRADWKSGGRFSTSEAETAGIYEAMAGWRDANGDWIGYWHLSRAASQYDDVYAEPSGSGLAYYPPARLPVLHVTFNPSGNEQGEAGFYWNDSITAQIPYDAFTQSGLPFSWMNPQGFTNDRCLYNRKVFRVTKLTPEGKIQQQPTVILLEATQLKPDECRDDPVIWNLIQANLGNANL
jgi:hypothetical protein